MNINCRENAKKSTKRWFPTTKGGSFRKWYGNKEYIVNWENDGHEIKNFKNEKGKLRSRPQNLKYYFKKGITWSTISSSSASFRYHDNSIFETKGSVLFVEKDSDYNYVFAFLNSKLVEKFLKYSSPTLDFHEGPIGKLPIITTDKYNKIISQMVKNSIEISKRDWDSFEISWDFKGHPFLINKEASSLIEGSFCKWQDVTYKRFYQLKENEEELNRIFIDLYGLQDELTPEVEEKDVTVRKADLTRDVKSFLSYLVGVMFGRYSLDKKGLAYAGGDWDNSLYTSYQPDETNIIPLTEDQYFNDDIMNKVEELLTVIYGEETLEENLTFIAEALTKKATESSRDRIRRYFMKEFYKDHLKTYQKRPIYWQFTSGKRGAFRGLMYLHRYHKHTIAQLRTDYVLHEAKVIDNLIQHESHVIRDESSTQAQKSRAQKLIDEYTKDRQELAQYDQVIDHVAKQQIDLDLDDGVKVNYEKFQNIEITDDSSSKTKTLNVFEKL